MSSFKSPAYNVKAVPVEKIVANSYNPNVVAPPEMKLLELSIWEDGYTMPLVCYYREEEDIYELVDGYHRYLVMKTSVRIYKRENGLLPVTVINKDISNRMASTIRHNRGQGNALAGTYDRYCGGTVKIGYVRQLDHAQHRHGQERVTPFQTNLRSG